MTNQRKRIWIDPFQTGLLLRIVIYLVGFQLLLWLFTSFFERIAKALEVIDVPIPLLRNDLARAILVFVVLFPPLALDAVRFAHRLVGPLYRFRKTMAAIAAGEPVPLMQLRKGDMLLDFRDDFNRMLKALEEKGLVVLQKPGQSAVPPAPDQRS